MQEDVRVLDISMHDLHGSHRFRRLHHLSVDVPHLGLGESLPLLQQAVDVSPVAVVDHQVEVRLRLYRLVQTSYVRTVLGQISENAHLIVQVLQGTFAHAETAEALAGVDTV